mgnify:CR=1 FL=1
MTTGQRAAGTGLVLLTLATGQIGSEDGAGKTIQGGVDGVVEVSIGVLP